MPKNGLSIRWVVAATILLLMAPIAYGWGPGTHVYLGNWVLENLTLLAPAAAALLARHPKAYLYGCIAADLIFAKRMSRIKLLCHRWSTGFRILDKTQTEEQRAFAWGYLSHLAADTVAHGRFVPRHVLLTNWPLELGHFYWELRAEEFVRLHDWATLREILDSNRAEFHRLVQSEVTGTLLPFFLNKALFDRMNRTILREGSLGRIARLRHWVGGPLPLGVVRRYHAESMDRMLDLLNLAQASAVLLDDPNGAKSFALIREQRRLRPHAEHDERRKLAAAIVAVPAAQPGLVLPQFLRDEEPKEIFTADVLPVGKCSEAQPV